MDNGARRALENKQNFLEFAGDIMEHVDPTLFGAQDGAFKALGLN
jgi:hypothetical protein